jgi:hypothetical protein
VTHSFAHDRAEGATFNTTISTSVIELGYPLTIATKQTASVTEPNTRDELRLATSPASETGPITEVVPITEVAGPTTSIETAPETQPPAPESGALTGAETMPVTEPTPALEPTDPPAPATGPLTPEETARREELELVIQKNLQGFIAVGEALMEIHDRRLYRDSHVSFAGYLRDRWNIELAHGYRLMEAAKTAHDLMSPIGDTLPRPSSESQIRPLAKLEPEQKREAWTKATEDDPDPSAKQVAAVVEAMKLDEKQDTTSDVAPDEGPAAEPDASGSTAVEGEKTASPLEQRYGSSGQETPKKKPAKAKKENPNEPPDGFRYYFDEVRSFLDEACSDYQSADDQMDVDRKDRTLSFDEFKGLIKGTIARLNEALTYLEVTAKATSWKDFD